MESPWKMFTQTQGQELINNTAYQWTTINGVNGYKFTNKSDSSKYIFLPAAGFWRDTSHYSYTSYGYYWSTSWYAAPYAWSLNFGSSYVRMSYYDRYQGYSIRSIKY